MSTLLLVSGAVALVFETLWFRQAGLVPGDSVWAPVWCARRAGIALGNLVASG